MSATNAQIVGAWNTVLFDKWIRFKHLVTVGLEPHGAATMDRCDPQRGERILDLGCGFGDTTLELARRVGPGGEAVGVDCAPNFVTSSREHAERAGIANATFFEADVQTDELRGPYDRAFSRFGTMFYNFPGAALGNVRRALRPGGRLTMVVWRKRLDNPWLYEAERCVRGIVPVVEASADGPATCGPGPFSMAGPDMVSDMMHSVGFGHVTFERYEAPICIGRDVEEAVEFAIQLGPAGEIVRLAGEEGERLRPRVCEELGKILSGMQRDGGVYADSSVWIVSARAR